MASEREHGHSDSEDELQYSAWTEKGVEAYASTRNHHLTLFGGAKGGSKTVTGCRIFQTDISNYRDGVFVVMRRNYTVLHTTTKVSFERFFPPGLILEKTDDVWRCVNNNEIWWRAADKARDRNYEKTRGLECSALFIDEASEFDEPFYEIVPSLLRRPAYHVDSNVQLRGYIYLTSNPVPGKNWLKRHFIDAKTRKLDGEHSFIQSLPDDNPLLPEGYIDLAFGTMSDPMKEMLRWGNWNVDEADFKIVPARALDAITVDTILAQDPIAAGIDIGLGHPDPSVVYCSNAAGEMWRHSSFAEYDTMEQVRIVSPLCRQIDAAGGRVYIDVGGVGKGVFDRLFEIFGLTIVPVSFGEAPEPESNKGQRQRYENRRAQLYFWLREDVMRAAEETSNGESPSVSIAVPDELFEDLEETYYIPVDGKLRLVPKQEIRSRLGRSPDDGDACVLCNAARREMQLAQFQFPTRMRSERRRRVSALTEGY